MAAGKPLKRSKEEKGSVIIEMAVIMPLFLLIVAGIIDLGFLFWEQEVLTNASREGARAAARAGVDGAADLTVTQVRQVVQDYLDKFNIKNAAGAPITLDSSNCLYQWNLGATPPTLSVQLQSIPVRTMMLPNIQTLYATGGISQVVNLSTQTTMAAEWDPTKPPSP